MAPVVEIDLTEQEIRERQAMLARELGVTVDEAYHRLDRGELRGTILEAKLSMLRFLLNEEP